ncbi:hypothetical protein DL765_010799 [Monosporascus sp. GIB2]|nr:hypothetical protein DL765_010799 [Monosporascus sp. GIB2]
MSTVTTGDSSSKTETAAADAMHVVNGAKSGMSDTSTYCNSTPRAEQASDRAEQPSRIGCRPNQVIRTSSLHPIHNCTARDEQASCQFRGSKNGAAAVARRDASGDAMGHRIDHLENLVKRLIAKQQQVPSPSTNIVYPPESPQLETGHATSALAADAQDVSGTGKTVMDGIHSVYLGGNDWHVVLQEINELKRTWSQEQDDQSDYDFRPVPSHTVDGSSLLFSQVKPIERIEILSTLPPKSEVDRLISHFFNRQAFPITVPRLLFSILGITMLAYHQYGEPPEYEGISESLFQLYRMRTAQCLLSGDIAKCKPYTVEALRFNATAELNRKDDNRRGLWIMTGLVVRAAINMGYHRDPSQSPGISLLQAEYRRRIWLSVISMDDMASFLGGFPRTTPALYSDTMEPRNLHDWELSENTTILPPSRPLSEPTPATYLIVKGRLFRALGRVADFNSTPSLGSYETVLEIDHAVCDAYQNFPPHMVVAPARDDIGTVRDMTNFSNLSLVCMYHKGMCILHRKFLAQGRLDGRFKFSRDRCISSALALLAFQQGLEPSFYKLSQTRQMLALAATILLLELELRRKAPDTEAVPESGVLLQALEKSCANWAEASSGCDEARRVHQFLVGMLSSCHTEIGTGTGTRTAGSSKALSPKTTFDLSGIGPQFDIPNAGFSFEMDSTNMDLDWVAWDTFIEEAKYENGPIY